MPGKLVLLSSCIKLSSTSSWRMSTVFIMKVARHYILSCCSPGHLCQQVFGAVARCAGGHLGDVAVVQQWHAPNGDAQGALLDPHPCPPAHTSNQDRQDDGSASKSYMGMKSLVAKKFANNSSPARCSRGRLQAAPQQGAACKGMRTEALQKPDPLGQPIQCRALSLLVHTQSRMPPTL